MTIRPLDVAALREQFRSAEPFPFFAVDEFLEPQFAREIAAAYPTFEQALELGNSFRGVNENLKVQITDVARFPAPVRRLSDALSSPEFLSDLQAITGIPNLLADDELMGGGMHVTGPTGLLDVHVDFNLIRTRDLHRRLNILVYLNEDWPEDWGGCVELWDSKVKNLGHSFAPTLGRCVVFETSEISYHGVTAVTCPPDQLRRSFAAYYYTREAPAHWDGKYHTTRFRARPDERWKRYVSMPASKIAKLGARIGRKVRGR